MLKNQLMSIILQYQQERNKLDNSNLDSADYLMQITELTWKYEAILESIFSAKWHEGWDDCLNHHGIVEDENGRRYSKRQVKEAKELKRK